MPAAQDFLCARSAARPHPPHARTEECTAKRGTALRSSPPQPPVTQHHTRTAARTAAATPSRLGSTTRWLLASTRTRPARPSTHNHTHKRVREARMPTRREHHASASARLPAARLTPHAPRTRMHGRVPSPLVSLSSRPSARGPRTTHPSRTQCRCAREAVPLMSLPSPVASTEHVCTRRHAALPCTHVAEVRNPLYHWPGGAPLPLPGKPLKPPAAGGWPCGTPPSCG